VAVASKYAVGASGRSGARMNTQRRCLSPGSAVARGRQEVFRSAHVLRRSRELVEVNRPANSIRVAPLLLQPPAGRSQGLFSTHPVRLARRHASVAFGGLGLQGRRRSLA
jgi:hypothetical protein